MFMQKNISTVPSWILLDQIVCQSHAVVDAGGRHIIGADDLNARVLADDGFKACHAVAGGGLVGGSDDVHAALGLAVLFSQTLDCGLAGQDAHIIGGRRQRRLPVAVERDVNDNDRVTRVMRDLHGADNAVGVAGPDDERVEALEAMQSSM